MERIGIIGAGTAARLHLQALSRIRGLRVVAIRDVDVQRATALAEEFNLSADVVADPARFYQERPQSVHIAAPPAVHEALALEALQHGAHVLVEKPPALTLAGCARLIAEAGRRGLSIGVNENMAMDPLIRRARAIIAAGRLGRLLQIDAFYSLGSRNNETLPDWADPLPGGMLEDLLPHLLTAARALTGGRFRVEHRHLATAGKGPRQDELRLLLSADNGLMVSIGLSLTANPRAFTLIVRGTRSTLTIDLRNMLLHLSRLDAPGGAIAAGGELIRRSLDALWQTTGNASGIAVGRREPPGSFVHSIRAHYAALQAGEEIPTPLRQNIENMGIIRHIWPLAEG